MFFVLEKIILQRRFSLVTTHDTQREREFRFAKAQAIFISPFGYICYAHVHTSQWRLFSSVPIFLLA